MSISLQSKPTSIRMAFARMQCGQPSAVKIVTGNCSCPIAVAVAVVVEGTVVVVCIVGVASETGGVVDEDVATSTSTLMSGLGKL